MTQMNIKNALTVVTNRDIRCENGILSQCSNVSSFLLFKNVQNFIANFGRLAYDTHFFSDLLIPIKHPLQYIQSPYPGGQVDRCQAYF